MSPPILVYDDQILARKAGLMCTHISGSIDVEETTTASSAAVTGENADETYFEDKISYNELFWPFTQAFKAPNVVR